MDASEKMLYYYRYDIDRFSGRCTHLSPLISGTFTGETMCINIKKILKAPNFQGKKKNPLPFGRGIGGREDLLVSHNLLCEAHRTAQDTQAVSEGEGIDGQVDSESTTRCLAGDIE